jgi:hypothetical protein
VGNQGGNSTEISTNLELKKSCKKVSLNYTMAKHIEGKKKDKCQAHMQP